MAALSVLPLAVFNQRDIVHLVLACTADGGEPVMALPDQELRQWHTSLLIFSLRQQVLKQVLISLNVLFQFGCAIQPLGVFRIAH